MRQAVESAEFGAAPDTPVAAPLQVGHRVVGGWERFGQGEPALTGEVDDGWVPARPFPMGRVRRRAFRALIRLLCPSAMSFPHMVDRVEDQVRRHMSYMPWMTALGLSMAFLLVDWMPRLLLQRWRRLQGLPVDDARALLTHLAESGWAPVRAVMYATRGIVLNAWFDQPEVHEALSYQPAPFMRSRIEVRRRLLAGRTRPEDTIPTYRGLAP
jgi:hypothetical protein